MMNFVNFFIEFSRGEMVKNTSHHMIAKDLQCYTGTLQGFWEFTKRWFFSSERSTKSLSNL